MAACGVLPGWRMRVPGGVSILVCSLYVQVTGFDWSAKADDASGSSWSRHAVRLLNSIVTDGIGDASAGSSIPEQDLNGFRADQLR